MSEFNITIESGTSKRLPTAGKYVDRDIIVTAEGGTDNPTGAVVPALVRKGLGSIDTGVDGANSNLKIEARYEFINMPTAYFNIIYAYASETSNATRIIYNKDSYVYCCLNSKTSDSLSSGQKRYPNVVYTDVLAPESSSTFSFTQNGVKTTKARTNGTALQGRNILVFTNSSSDDGVDIKLYYLKIYDGSTLIRHLVPHITESGECGLYDLVGHRFYGNTGKGEFEIEGGNSDTSGGDDTMVGIWIFNEVLDLPEFDFYFNFVLTNVADSPQFHNLYSPGDDWLYYYDVDNTDYVPYENGAWVLPDWRTITITEEPTDSECIEWLKANARKATYEDGIAEGEKAILSTYIDWSVSTTSNSCIVEFVNDCDYYAHISLNVLETTEGQAYNASFVLAPYEEYYISEGEMGWQDLSGGEWAVSVVIHRFSKDGV